MDRVSSCERNLGMELASELGTVSLGLALFWFCCGRSGFNEMAMGPIFVVAHFQTIGRRKLLKISEIAEKVRSQRLSHSGQIVVRAAERLRNYFVREAKIEQMFGCN